MPFNLCYVHLLVLRMVADGMQLMNNIKCGFYSFYVRHNLSVGFPHHYAQYGHYFITQLSAATCSQFTVLTWPTVLTAHWGGEVTTESDKRYLWDRMVLTGLTYIYKYVWGEGGEGTVNGVFIYRTQKGKLFCDLMRRARRNFLHSCLHQTFETKKLFSAQLSTGQSL